MFELLTVLAALCVIWMVTRLYTACTENTDRHRSVDQGTRTFPVAAAVHIYQGAFVGLDPAGYLKPFEAGDLFGGIAYEEADNTSGLAGAIGACEVWVSGDFELTLSSAALKDAGKPIYATDDNTLALTGHTDAFMGTILHYVTTDTVVVRLKAPGQKPPNGKGSIELAITGHEDFVATGATAGTLLIDGFDGKSALGLGILANDAENAGIKFSIDATAEIALASIRTLNDCLPVDKGVTFECELVVSDSGDHAALDIDWGLGTALTSNSEADIDHTDMAQLACFHLDGASDNILAQSDDATTDVAPVDTTIDNDASTDVPKKFKIIVRPDGTVEFWIDGARVLDTTEFKVLSTANLGAFVNLEKTSNDTVAEVIFRNLRVCGGCAA